VRAVAEANVTAADAVVGVSASGATPFTVAGTNEAQSRGALTIAVVCAEDSPLARSADHAVVAIVGPELVAGSTRLKAGTAQKLILNTISTVTMIRLGKTYGNLMVDVRAGSEKLRARARRAVELATGAKPEEAEAALAAADGAAKVAIVSLLLGIDAQEARKRLDEASGGVRKAVAG
jgi:N-acetylmuramic acid 6-phosphate etherase